MSKKELEQLEKKSIHTLRINNDLKDSILRTQLNELIRLVNSEKRKRKLVIVLIEDY